MTNKTEIFNQTLMEAEHTKRVNDPAEKTPEALHCASCYDQHRRAILSMANWGFAKSIVALSPTSDTPAVGWDYEYSYPSNVLVVRGIARTLPGDKKIPYDTGSVYDPVTKVQKRVIWTNEAGASVVVTRDVQLPSMFPPLFVQALTTRMAADVGPLLGKTVRDKKLNEFQGWINLAIQTGAIEAEDVEQAEPDWITDR